jgi:hypothetical protein
MHRTPLHTSFSVGGRAKTWADRQEARTNRSANQGTPNRPPTQMIHEQNRRTSHQVSVYTSSVLHFHFSICLLESVDMILQKGLLLTTGTVNNVFKGIHVGTYFGANDGFRDVNGSRTIAPLDLLSPP